MDFGFVKPTVSVGDFVWEDTNRNGVQDAGEPGIKGVELKVTIGGDVPVKGVDGKPVKPVMTDANGMYKFEKLPALGAGKSYTVKVTNPAGYVPTKANVGDSAKDSSTGMAKSGDLTKNGDKDMTLDFGFVTSFGTIRTVTASRMLANPVSRTSSLRSTDRLLVALVPRAS